MTAKPWSEAVDFKGHHPFLSLRPGRNPQAVAGRKTRWARAIDVLLPATPERGARWVMARDVWRIACEYNGYLVTSQNAPRIKTVIEELNALHRAAKTLANAIDALGDKTIEVLEKGGEEFETFDADYVALRDRVFTLGFPRWAGFPYDDPDDGYLVPRLRLLEKLCDECSTRFVNRLGKDNGGGIDLYRREWGSPTWHLANLCYMAVHDWGHQPTSTEGGIYHQFTAAVHEFATGDSNEPPGLRDQLKNGVAITGRLMQLMEKMPKYFGDPNASITEAESEEFHQLSLAAGNGRRPLANVM